MAVAGEISEIPLPELLSVLAGKTGILRMERIPHITRIDVHIDSGNITGCLVDDRSLRKEAQLYDKLVAVTASPSGTFRFFTAEAHELAHRFQIAVNRAAIEVASRVDEIVSNRATFPPAAQVFRWTGNRAGVASDDEGLQEFILDAADILRFGSNAERLAGIVQLSVAQVQCYLRKLLDKECIAPLGRDALWSKLNKTLETKSSGLRLAQEKATGSPGFVAGPAKPRQMPSSTGQKVVPILRRSKENKDDPPKAGKITRLIK